LWLLLLIHLGYLLTKLALQVKKCKHHMLTKSTFCIWRLLRCLLYAH